LPAPADFLRTQSLSHPLILFLLSLACCGLVSALYAKTATKVAGTFPGKVPATFSTLVLAAAYGAAVTAYVLLPAYFDHVEPAVAAISWAVMRGQEAYPGPDAAEMYGLPYGPMLYLMNGLTMTLFGPSLVSSKAAGALGAAASVVIFALAARRGQPDSWPRAVRWMVILYLMFGVPVVWARAEPLLLLCSSLAVLSLTFPPLASSAIAGVALGVGVNLKVSAVLYLAPLMLTLWNRTGLLYVAATVVVATVTAAIPFVWFENISAGAYVYWIQTTAAHGFRAASIPTSLEWAIFILLPAFLPSKVAGTFPDKVAGTFPAKVAGTFPAEVAGQADVLRWLLTACVLLSVPLAAKHGTGVYHFLPFVPAVLFAAGDRVRFGTRTGAAIALTCTIAIALQVPDWTARATALPAQAIVDEIHAHDVKQPGSMSVGYSASYRLSFFRPVLVFSGHPYLLDGASIMDRHWSRRPFPASAIDAIRGCAIDVWLIPAGEPPFILPNAYPAEGSVFPKELGHAFQEHYRVVDTGRWYDAWRCQQ
jgi:hypothetical protein